MFFYIFFIFFIFFFIGRREKKKMKKIKPGKASRLYLNFLYFWPLRLVLSEDCTSTSFTSGLCAWCCLKTSPQLPFLLAFAPGVVLRLHLNFLYFWPLRLVLSEDFTSTSFSSGLCAWCCLKTSPQLPFLLAFAPGVVWRLHLNFLYFWPLRLVLS